MNTNSSPIPTRERTDASSNPYRLDEEIQITILDSTARP